MNLSTRTSMNRDKYWEKPLILNVFVQIPYLEKDKER